MRVTRGTTIRRLKALRAFCLANALTGCAAMGLRLDGVRACGLGLFWAVAISGPARLLRVLAGVVVGFGGVWVDGLDWLSGLVASLDPVGHLLAQ